MQPATTRLVHPLSTILFQALGIMVLCAIPILSYWLWLRHSLLAEENGPLEAAQVSLILLACGLHLLHLLHLWRKSQLDKFSPLFIVHAGLALLTYSFALRELDFELFGSSPYWLVLEKGLRLLRTALWLGFFVLLYRKAATIFPQWIFLLKLPIIWISMVGGVFLIAGGLFDREVFSSISKPLSRLAEEALELNGYFLVFVAALYKPTALLTRSSKIATDDDI